jgi:hypothetical protein
VLNLLFVGADTRLKDARGFDVMVEAARGGHGDVIDVLTRGGAKAGISGVLQVRLHPSICQQLCVFGFKHGFSASDKCADTQWYKGRHQQRAAGEPGLFRQQSWLLLPHGWSWHVNKPFNCCARIALIDRLGVWWLQPWG